MAKRLFLLLIISLIGVISTPKFLAASDSAKVTNLNTDKVVETVIPPEPEPEPEPEPAYASYVKPATLYAVSYEEPKPAVQNYTVTTYIGSVNEYVNTASNLSYSSIYKYNKMIYGHNTGNLLGSLAYRYIGETITITEGGVARSYEVAAIRTYAKTSDGNLEGDPHLMAKIANTALGYDVALLTCSGTSYGNGDASHRLVVFANLQ